MCVVGWGWGWGWEYLQGVGDDAEAHEENEEPGGEQEHGQPGGLRRAEGAEGKDEIVDEAVVCVAVVGAAHKVAQLRGVERHLVVVAALDVGRVPHQQGGQRGGDCFCGRPEHLNSCASACS